MLVKVYTGDMLCQLKFILEACYVRILYGTCTLKVSGYMLEVCVI